MSCIENITRKIGYLHIPKCGGSSLNKAIYESLGYKNTHIPSSSNKKTKEWINDPYSLIFRFASNSHYLSGHLTFNELKSLKRDFIFTVLRDPKFRLFSLFTYKVSKANNAKITINNSVLALKKNMTFKEFLDDVGFHSMSYFLLSVKFNEIEISEINQKLFEGEVSKRIVKNMIRPLLKSFDAIYSEDQNVLEELEKEGVLSCCNRDRVNESNQTLSYRIGMSELEFYESLRRFILLDELAYEVSMELFPLTVTKPLSSVDEFLQNIKARYNLIFEN